MLAKDLGECLLKLGGPPGQEIEFIEIHYGHWDFLDNICRSINSKLIFDRIRTEQQNDKCEVGDSAFMYPANCGLKFEGCVRNCTYMEYIGFYCTGNCNL